MLQPFMIRHQDERWTFLLINPVFSLFRWYLDGSMKGSLEKLILYALDYVETQVFPDSPNHQGGRLEELCFETRSRIHLPAVHKFSVD